MEFFCRDGVKIRNGDVIDVHQTVNGRSQFVVLNAEQPLDIRYAFDISMRYEYNQEELLSSGNPFDPDESEIEVIGNVQKYIQGLGK